MQPGAGEEKGSPVRELYEWLETVVFSVVAVVLVFTFFCRTVGVDGSSMEPTLHHGDRVVISHLLYRPAPGDIVVITQPNSADVPIIKRIVADEGQIVSIDFEAGTVWVDGQALEEPYTLEPTYLSRDVQFPVEVPPGCVFVLGDNRNRSLDSRDSGIGMIDKQYILGKAVFRLFPLKGAGRVS